MLLEAYRQVVDFARLFTLQLPSFLFARLYVESASASELLNFVISLTWHELMFELRDGLWE